MAWTRRTSALPSNIRLGLHNLFGLFETDMHSDVTVNDWVGNPGRSIDVLLDTAAAIDTLLEGDADARYHFVELDLWGIAERLTIEWLRRVHHAIAAELLLRDVARG